MKTISIIIVLLFAAAFSSFAASQIILINAEPYLVDLNEEYDIEKVYHKVPDYFSNPETHEEILAHQVRELNKNSKLTSIDDGESSNDLTGIETKIDTQCPLASDAPLTITTQFYSFCNSLDIQLNQQVFLFVVNNLDSHHDFVARQATLLYNNYHRFDLNLASRRRAILVT